MPIGEPVILPWRYSIYTIRSKVEIFMNQQKNPSAPLIRPVDGTTGMEYSPVVNRTGGEGSRAWDVHGKAMGLAREGGDIIFLSIGDPDFDTPSAIIEEAVHALRNGRTHYTDFAGMPELRAAIAVRHNNLTGLNVTADQVVVLSGGQAALFAAAMCVAGPGDEFIVPEPMYSTYMGVVGVSGADLVSLPLKRENNFHLDIDDLRAAITPKSRALLLNFPHNPTGAMLTREEIDGLAEVCREHNLWVISDEVYASLTYGPEFLSPAIGEGMAERTVCVSSLSKSHAMPGWRLGWLVTPPGDMANHIMHVVQCMLFGTPPFVMDAALVAVTNDFEEVDEMIAAYRERRELVVQRISEIPKISCVEPEGGMFVMLDIRDSGLGAAEFANRLLETVGVTMIPGTGFGEGGEGHLRMSLTASKEILVEAMDRIERFVIGLNG
jgi:arginine:pyruvate transaminase